MTKSTEDRNPLEILSEEFLDRRRQGESLSVSEFADSHPELSDKIRRLFPAMMALESCKSSRLSNSATARPVDLSIGSLEQLGDYRIVSEIGRGGMGVVYEAEQQSLQRRVAVKVFPRQALPNSRHLDRFLREAKTAARLHHTNIVPVFGVGQQDDLHYYVMQRIDGTSLDEVIQLCCRRDSNGRQRLAGDDTQGGDQESTDPAIRLSPSAEASRQLSASPLWMSAARFRSPSESLHEVPCSGEQWRLLLDRSGQPLWNAIANVGIQVAEALEYAHLQGVLHRDIKPSNLLLDHQGTVWVTDFGLATALEAEQLAYQEEVAGTLRFMAPEQISGTHDARSDIYSLGLTLYELMTLSPAFDDPSRTMLLSRIMKGVFVPPREIRAEIPRDLEAIVMRAMARDSKDRYARAADLAGDLRRFVQGRPVAARPVNPVLQLSRWTRRNPAVASLGAALLLTAITSFFVVGAKWKDAVAENQRAEVNLTLALESMDQILQRFTSSWMAHPIAGDSDATDLDAASLELQMAVSDHSAAVLQDALEFYDRFAQQNPTNPQLYRDTAKVHRRVADIYQRLGQHAKAEEAYQRSLGFLNATQIANDGSLDLERIETLNQLGFSMYSASRFGDSEREFRRALSLLGASPQGNTPLGRAQDAKIRTNLAQCLSLTYRLDEGKQSQGRAVDILEQLVQEYPSDSVYQLELARAYRGQYWLMGFRRFEDGDDERAEREAIRSAGVEILEGLVRNYPNVPDYRCELGELLITTASNSRFRKDTLDELNQAVSLSRELTDLYPSIPRYRAVLARGLLKLADCKCEKHLAESDRLFDESIELFRSLVRSFPDLPVYRMFLVHALHEQAETLRRLDYHTEACAAMKLAAEEQSRYVQMRPDNDGGRKFLAKLQANLREMEAVNQMDRPD